MIPHHIVSLMFEHAVYSNINDYNVVYRIPLFNNSQNAVSPLAKDQIITMDNFLFSLFLFDPA